jgi:pseudaminic acid cytidylyltransferase
MKRLLIIPARSGSKRIKHKNIKVFYGKPIIQYTIDIAKRSKLFKKIHVSTNCQEYKNLVEKLGLKIDFLRPQSLATDKITLKKVFFFVNNEYNKMGYYFDEIWFISSCAPLLKLSDLIEASKKFYLKNSAFITVSKFPAPIEWAFKISKSKLLKPLNYKLQNMNSQNFKSYFYDTGIMSAYKSKVVTNNFKNFKNKYYSFEIPFYRGIDVDNYEDWTNLKKIYKLTK